MGERLKRPSAEDVLAYIFEFQGHENDAEEVRDFVQAAAQLVEEEDTTDIQAWQDNLHTSAFYEWVQENRD